MTKELPELTALLESAPVPASRVTVASAVQSGRRSIRRRRNLMTGTAAATVAAIVGTVSFAVVKGRAGGGPEVANTPSASAAPSASPVAKGWALEVLPLPAGVNAGSGSAIDPAGRYIAGSVGGDIILWDNGVPALLPKREGLTQTMSLSVNTAGVVAGTSTFNDGLEFGWTYRDGTFTKLPKPPKGGRYQVRGINARGDVIGWSEKSGALLWRASKPGQVEVLSGPSGDVVVSGISDDGTMVGNLGDGDSAYIWYPDGTGAKLKGPGGKAEAIAGEWVGGYVPAKTQSNLMGARWNLRTGELVTFPKVDTPIFDITEQGAMLSPGDKWANPLVITPAGELVYLPGPEGVGVGKPLFFVSAMNGDATMVVGVKQEKGKWTPILWRWH